MGTYAADHLHQRLPRFSVFPCALISYKPYSGGGHKRYTCTIVQPVCRGNGSLQMDRFIAFMQVATHDDPASARLGESLYHFVPRSIAGNWKDATAIERARLHAHHQSPRSVHNR